METAVRAADVSKHYDMYRRPADRLIELLTRRPHHTTFSALERVSFDVEKGETIGIIGQNGAGKSTLLKLLCGVTQPSSGALETHGTIASILELGTGFHPEFTGRDNAALNAAILGLTASQVRASLPAIIEFSELGSFIDRPVKTYSSGMYMRLAFSVAVNVDPDILVIDEALAVGDGHFQKKCIDRIREFQDAGKTILFCSHSLYYISSICRRTLWLDHGRVMRYGPSLDVVHEYESFLLERDREHPAHETAAPQTQSPVRFRELVVCDRAGAPRERFARGEDIHVRIRVDADSPDQPIHVIVGVHRAADEMQVFTVGTHDDGLPPLSGRTEYELTVRLQNVPLLRGDYSIIAFVGDENALTAFDRRDVRPAFSMTSDRFDVGVIAVEHRWDLHPSDAQRPEPVAALDRR
ncbi:MAG TPA: ABC transporter ATP-binding protein [Thermoanaerobaculia bacterium]|nr:ABC transporter ATP-binding protein [Thermoanaerobaculia bacterium]